MGVDFVCETVSCNIGVLFVLNWMDAVPRNNDLSSSRLLGDYVRDVEILEDRHREISSLMYVEWRYVDIQSSWYSRWLAPMFLLGGCNSHCQECEDF